MYARTNYAIGRLYKSCCRNLHKHFVKNLSFPTWSFRCFVHGDKHMRTTGGAGGAAAPTQFFENLSIRAKSVMSFGHGR